MLGELAVCALDKYVLHGNEICDSCGCLVCLYVVFALHPGH